MKKKKHHKRSIKFKDIKREQSGNSRTGFRKPKVKWDSETALEREDRFLSR